MEILLSIIVLILGMCFGSFINMLVYRTAVSYELVRKKFKVKGRNRSFCDYCGRQLNWYENVPTFSFLIQKGKTRCCQKKLSLAYPIVEILMGILFVINFQFLMVKNQLNLFSVILGTVIIVFLVFSTVFDLKYMILPDFSTYILIAISFIGIIFDEKNVLPYLLSALIASGFLLVLNLITKGKGMGLGDVKLAIFMGLFLGFPKIVVAFYLAFIIGAVVGIILILLKKAKSKSAISFGPFLILGTVMAWWWGQNMLDLFKKILGV